jgi:hypothetical protein
MNQPDNVLDSAIRIVMRQMDQLKSSGLIDAASHMVVGINGGKESEIYADICLPAKAQKIYHGLESHAENLTICALHEWAQTHRDWVVFYAHSKGATHLAGSNYGDNVAGPWREGMMKYLVGGWRQCVLDLEAGHDIAAAHWMWNMADGTQHIPAGNFLWLKADFIADLPSMHLRDRIKVSGISNVESRYEAEVFWGNGRRPNVVQYLPNGGEGVP